MSDQTAPAEQSELQAAIALGNDMESFLRSSVGVHIIQRAREEMLDALQRLKAIDPYEVGIPGVAKAQNDVRVPELVIVWCHQAIDAGKDAAAQLQQRESEPSDPV